MESRNSSPTPGQSGQEDREEDVVDDGARPNTNYGEESNSEAVSCSRHDDDDDDDDDVDDDQRPGPSSRFRQIADEPSESANSEMRIDSDSEPDCDRFPQDDNTSDDSDGEWAASSSGAADQDALPDHASPRPSTWNGATTQSTSWSISSSSNFPSAFAVASSHVSASFVRSSNSPVASTSREVSNPPSPSGEPGPSTYRNERRDDLYQAEPISASAHGEISNPPSPLGGQVVEDSDMRAADSPQAGPSGYFSRPDPVSNPSSPQAGPSTGVPKKRNVHPDSLASNKRGRFEPTPGPSGLCNLRSSLTVSSSEAVAMSLEPMSPYMPNSPMLPHTPADNYLISSSTGLIDSVPPTPAESLHESNDLSVPSPVVNRRVNYVDDGVDSTVDSSGYPMINHAPVDDDEDDNADDEIALQQHEAESGYVQSSEYPDSSDEDFDDLVVSCVARNSCSNSNDAISTSGQVDESGFERRDRSDRNRRSPGLACDGNGGNFALMDDDEVRSGNALVDQSHLNDQLHRNNISDVIFEPSSSHDLSSGSRMMSSSKADSAAMSSPLFISGPSTSKGYFHHHQNVAFPDETQNSESGRSSVDSSNPEQRTPFIHEVPDNSQEIGVRPSTSNNGAQSSSSVEVGDDSLLQNFRDGSYGNKSCANFDQFIHDLDGSNEVNLNSGFPLVQPFDHPLELEDIQEHHFDVANFLPGASNDESASDEAFVESRHQSDRPGTSSVTSSEEQQPPFSIGLAFTGIPDSASPSTSGMTGPLSKRLRTLHTLQLQKEHTGLNQKEDNEKDNSYENFPFNPSDHPRENNGNGNNDDSDSGGSLPFFGGTQHTFSVTIETIGHGNAIKPKKFFQQKSAEDSRLMEELEGKGSPDPVFDVLSPFVHPMEPRLSASQLSNSNVSVSKRVRKCKVYWCPGCLTHYNEECVIHKKVTLQIVDQPVMSRARASLPSSYLVIKRISKSESGVFTKKMIPQSCRFGPVEGRNQLIQPHHSVPNNSEFKLLVKNYDGTVSHIDISSEEISNWMRFVRPATSASEQNAVLCQVDDQLFFITTRSISPKTELRVWYSPEYIELFEATHNLKPLELEDECYNEESSDSPWHCFCCKQRFKTSSLLQQHLLKHDLQETCKGKRFKGRGKMAQGSRLKNYDKKSTLKIRCPICPRYFDRQFSYQRHLLLHRGDKCYKCDECKASFSLLFSLKKHKQQVHFKDPSGSYSRCPTCGFWFLHDVIFNVHTLTHTPKWEANQEAFEELLSHTCRTGDLHCSESRYVCPECHRDFKLWHNFVDHTNEHGLKRLPYEATDRPSASRLATTTSKFLHKCELCYKAFATEERLSRHMAVHGSEDGKPIACRHCDKRFLNNSALACHLKVHSEENSLYDCPICSVTFEQINLLKEHVHTHKKDNTYTCPHCMKAFSSYPQIRKHIRAFHSEKKFQCSQCEKSFTGSDKLKAHMIKHSDVREFQCPSCDKQFKRKDKLKDHVKRIHSEESRIKSAIASKKTKNEMKPAPPQNPVKSQNKPVSDDYHRFLYKCHDCQLGFKRRGMLVNHMAKRHPEIPTQNVPELNLPILKETKDYYCQYCSKVYKSASKRKVHILKNHPGAKIPPSIRDKEAQASGQVDMVTFAETVGSIRLNPFNCSHCHKQYASNAKLLQHIRKKHPNENEPKQMNWAPGNPPEDFDPRVPIDVDPVVKEPQVSYVTVDASAVEVGGNGGGLLHIQNVYPSTSGMQMRSDRNAYFNGDDGSASFGSGINLSEAEIVPYGDRGTGAEGMACRIVDGEILQLPLTRVHQSDALRLASSGATVIHVSDHSHQTHQLHPRQLHVDRQSFHGSPSHHRSGSVSGVLVYNVPAMSISHPSSSGPFIMGHHQPNYEAQNSGSNRLNNSNRGIN